MSTHLGHMPFDHAQVYFFTIPIPYISTASSSQRIACLGIVLTVDFQLTSRMTPAMRMITLAVASWGLVHGVTANLTSCDLKPSNPSFTSAHPGMAP
jgi:hypothetical protein